MDDDIYYTVWITKSLRMAYIFNSSLRCADFTRARNVCVRKLKFKIHHFTSDPVTMLKCYVISCDVMLCCVLDGKFLAKSIFQTLF